MQIRVRRLSTSARLPSYAHAGDAAFDLHTDRRFEIFSGQRVQIPTGIAVAIPEGFVGLIWEKSGLSHKHGLIVLGGVVDAGYRGEVMVGIANLSDRPYAFAEGDKVAQMIVQRREEAVFEKVDSFDEATARGIGGFGSTGR